MAKRQPLTTGGSSPLRNPDISQTSMASTRFFRASSKRGSLRQAARQIGRLGHDHIELLAFLIHGILEDLGDVVREAPASGEISFA